MRVVRAAATDPHAGASCAYPAIRVRAGGILFGKKIVVVMPAYNAETTLRQTYAEIPLQYVDDVILVDDGSSDRTAQIAKSLGVRTLVHRRNLGYGGNQKTCYADALHQGVDVVVMLHPDYQYTPKLIPAMASLIASGLYAAVLGSRILGGRAIAGGMPRWKYAGNRALTLVQNLLFGAKLSEYHTGYRAFARPLLEQLPLDANSDDFVFDSQMLAQILWFDHVIGEISCPTKYFPEASSIGFGRSVTYGLGVLRCGVEGLLARLGLWRHPRYRQKAIEG